MPPDNGAFMVAAYVVAAVIVVAYAVSLALRLRGERRRSGS
jgi:putative exporter of polyketide antibiotics